MKKIIYIFFILFLFNQNVEAQCAMCKASVETSMEASKQAAGVNAGVLYVLVFVAFALSFFVYIFYKGNQVKK